MTLYLTGRDGTRDISQLAVSAAWSGDKASICRQLTLRLVNLPDSGLPSPRTGDVVTLVDGETLFTGYAVQRSLDSEGVVMSVSCYDRGIYLRNNHGTYKFRDKTPEDICRTVCADHGIPISALAETGVPVSRKFSAVSLDKIATTAYTLAAEQTGKRYAVRMTPEGLLVKEKGQSEASLNLRPRSNLIQASTTESIVNMCNSVAIYSQEGSLLRTVNDQGAVDLYGMMQRHVTEKKGADAAAQAKALLDDGALARTVTVEVLGDQRLVTGETVVVEESITGLSGVFWIDADRHTWQRGQYRCRLTLNCRSVMNQTTAGSELT